MKKLLFPLLSIFFVVSLNAQDITLELFASGFARSLDIQHAGDERLFIVEQEGLIKILNPDGTTNATPFLDIQSIVGTTFNEQGLLGLAFHPDYTNNGYFYVHYSNNAGDTQISRFSVDSGNGDIADPGSELPILDVIQPYTNHNGGSIAFGPDGYLYIALGDGGSGGDPDNYAQNRLSLLGKMLRIDIDNPSGGNNYGIPADNPFVSDPDTLDEIWAIGLRNPFRFSFDFTDGKIWIGDVGQSGSNSREEVNSQDDDEGGLNYGWRCYEGNVPFNTAGCLSQSEYTFPVYNYPWNGGGSVIGGRVYRGSTYLDLDGLYIFGDIDGMIGTLDTSFNFVDYTSGNPSGTWVAFGADITGEMYAVSLSGNVYKILGGQIASTEDFQTLNFSVYPNPSNEEINIKSETESIATITIFDINGREMYSDNRISNASKTIDVSSFSKGFYLIEVTSERGSSNVKKLIVN